MSRGRHKDIDRGREGGKPPRRDLAGVSIVLKYFVIKQRECRERERAVVVVGPTERVTTTSTGWD